MLGCRKRYECTFPLHAGWDAARETAHYRDFVRDESADWPAVADVFRKWVLNESGRYSAAPFGLDRYDFAAISAEDFLLAVPRRLEQCLSADGAGNSLGVVVEVSCDAGLTWRRYGGPVRVSAQECSVWLADDALPADYFAAAVGHTARVRVTATVASDRRLSVKIAGDAGDGSVVARLARAGWAKVNPGSIFYGQSAYAADERDDTARLEQWARRLSEAGGAAAGEFTLAMLDVGRNVGDLVPQVQGRGLDLAVAPGFVPHVVAVEHRGGEEWVTHLKVSG